MFYPVLDLAHAVQAEVDKQMQREPHTVAFASVPDRPYNDLRYLLDISKAYRELDWQPRISFDEGQSVNVPSDLRSRSGSSSNLGTRRETLRATNDRRSLRRRWLDWPTASGSADCSRHLVLSGPCSSRSRFRRHGEFRASV
jgi:hypothetical protein